MPHFAKITLPLGTFKARAAEQRRLASLRNNDTGVDDITPTPPITPISHFHKVKPCPTRK